MDVDFNYASMTLRDYQNWKTRADAAKVAFVPFGGGPYYGYEVGVIDAMHELGIVPDAMLPGCIGDFIGMYYLMALVEGRHPTYYIDQFSKNGLLWEKDYVKAPIPPFFAMRVAQWMRGFAQYYTTPQAYQNLFAPEFIPNMMKAGMDYMMNPTDRNLGIFTRNACVCNPMARLLLGGYFFAPIGPFAELYNPQDPDGWIDPAINWGSVYSDTSPIYIMSLLKVGAAEVVQSTNCADHPAFAPVDGRRLASGSNLPWLIAETYIDGSYYRESAVRDVATLTPTALDSLPSLDVCICVQIMDSNDTDMLSIDNGNHNNYALQVTEMVATIGDDDIKQAMAYQKQKGRDTEWIVIEAQSDAKPFWTHENIARCRQEGYEIAMHKFMTSEKLRPYIKHTPRHATPQPAHAGRRTSVLREPRANRTASATVTGLHAAE
ncbi:alpha/beta hydrolase [uncultured Rhodospira sp.]|uniref:alpha/beta hydrolase n=1 Tax=uncultured Rhodospira sp. TaxID=1936189 RepID=UPI002635CCF6|nr:alpha/beta hydrolase [uncultured Rhodospira sp.]